MKNQKTKRGIPRNPKTFDSIIAAIFWNYKGRYVEKTVKEMEKGRKEE